MNKKNFIRTNDQIRSPELRVIDDNGDNLGTLSREEALTKAHDAGLDLVEISPTATPPVAKIMSYGKFQYDQKKKAQKAKAKAHSVETKAIQIKMGTGDHDLNLKAKKVSDWLKKGNRVKVELFLKGRSKYMEKDFLEKRLNRVLDLITESYKIADGPKKSPKGLVAIVERTQQQQEEQKKEE